MSIVINLICADVAGFVRTDRITDPKCVLHLLNELTFDEIKANATPADFKTLTSPQTIAYLKLKAFVPTPLKHLPSGSTPVSGSPVRIRSKTPADPARAVRLATPVKLPGGAAK